MSEVISLKLSPGALDVKWGASSRSCGLRRTLPETDDGTVLYVGGAVREVLGTVNAARLWLELSLDNTSGMIASSSRSSPSTLKDAILIGGGGLLRGGEV